MDDRGPCAEAVEDIVAPFGVTAVLEHVQGVPPVVNDPEAIEALRRAAERHGARAARPPQTLGGEDFAWYLRKVPGAMAAAGHAHARRATYDLHQGDLVVDENSVVQGARLLAGAVVAGVVKSSAGTDSRGSVTVCKNCATRLSEAAVLTAILTA